MSEFRRTRSGLNNLNLFYNVDIIVYVEGGPVSYTKEEVYSGSYTKETIDIIFWKNIFNHFIKDKKIKYKSVGSKKTIKEIALDIINGNLTKVFVAMDSEFDGVFGQRIEHPHVFYTFGYSFENDIWSDVVIKAIIEELTAVEIENNDIENNFYEFIRKIKLAVYADGYLFRKNSSFFPRKSGHLFCVDCNPIDLPYIRTIDINNKITQKKLKKGTLYAFGRRLPIEPIKLCYGHLFADYCCQLIIHYIKKRHSLTVISKDIIHRMGVKKFFQLEFLKGQIYKHYELQFNRIFI